MDKHFFPYHDAFVVVKRKFDHKISNWGQWYSCCWTILHSFFHFLLVADSIIFFNIYLVYCVAYNFWFDIFLYFSNKRWTSRTLSWSCFLPFFSLDYFSYMVFLFCQQINYSLNLWHPCLSFWKCLQVMLTTQLKVYVRGRLFEKSRDLLVELDTLGFAKDEVNKAQTDMFMSHQSCIFYLLFFRWKFRVKKLYQQVVFRFNNFQILCFSLVFSSAHLVCNFLMFAWWNC